MDFDLYTPESSEYQPSPNPVSLGFASAINRSRPLDINLFLVSHPDSTFFIRVKGDSMRDCRIYSGDILIVDRSLTVKSEDLVFAVYNGVFVVKKIVLSGQKPNIVTCLLSSGDDPEIIVGPNDDFEIWGQITYTIHCHVS